jgi:hypothetical protein
MADMAAEHNGFEDGGFDYDEGDGNVGHNVFEDRGMVGGIENAMGFEGEDNLLAMEEELNNAGGGNEGQA